MNICFLYLELPFFVCHHTCYVILPADPNCLPEGCIALAASHHQDTVFLSLELCLQNLERGEPVWAMKHLCAATQGHTEQGPSASHGSADSTEPLPSPGVPGAPQVPWAAHRWDTWASHSSRLSQPKWGCQLPKVAVTKVMDAGRSSLPPRASPCCGQWCLQHFPHSGKYSRHWFFELASLTLQLWEYGVITLPCQWQRGLKSAPSCFPEGVYFLPADRHDWLYKHSLHLWWQNKNKMGNLQQQFKFVWLYS